MVVCFATIHVTSTGEIKMLVLLRQHLRHNNISPRQFLRASYQRQYGNDMPEMTLTNDTKILEEQGVVPVYAINLLLDYYGESSCK